jgi:hypothetical protein
MLTFIRMTSRLGIAFSLVILSFLSGWIAHSNSDLPEFGVNHDDSIYFVSAKSIAEGQGYRIPSLAEDPYQTKYGPLFPLYMSLAWKIEPEFPANLRIAAFLGWLTIPVFLFLSLCLFRRWGLTGARPWILLLLLAINPYVIHFGISVFSEMFFTCLVLGGILCLGKSGAKWAIAAGLLGGLAYLTRSAGLALLIAGPLVLIWRGQRRFAMLFAASMLPAVIGWTLWTRVHQAAEADEILLYYTNYLSYARYAISLPDVPVVLWKNSDGLLYAMGAMALPEITSALIVKILTQVLGVAMISGIVRMTRRGVARDYAIFGAISAAMMLVWYFPPNERFVLPIAPLLLAGLLTEMEHLLGLLRGGMRHKDWSQKIVAAGFGAVLAAILIGAVALQVFTVFSVMPDAARHQREIAVEQRAAYRWIAENLPQNAGFVAYDDPVLYLQTGHHALTLTLPPKYWYREDRNGMVAFYGRLVDFAHAHGAGYVYFTSEDLDREVGGEDKAAVMRAITTNPDLTAIEHTKIGTIYRVR